MTQIHHLDNRRMNTSSRLSPEQQKLANRIDQKLDAAEKLAAKGRRAEARMVLEEVERLIKKCYADK